VSPRRAGAALGAAILAVPPLAFALWATRANPWFLDAPLSFFALGVLPAAALGAAVGAGIGRGSAKLALLLGMAEVAALFACAAAPKPPPVPARLLVFGIDGASWEMVDRLALPHLAALQERGTRAVLRSREPMFSPLLWTTMATGVVPEEHGIHGFKVSADHCRAARFWDVAWADGQSIGIYKWLVTWPPEPTRPGKTPEQGGFVVPAWLAPDARTWPAELSPVKEIELARRLKRKQVAAVRPPWKLVLAGIPQGFRWSSLAAAVEWSLRERLLRPSPEERAWRLQLLRVQLDRDVFIRSMHRHRPEVLSFTTYATDALGHTHWGYMESGEGGALADALPAAYRQADAVLGEVLANLGDDTAVLVVSDHGFRAMAAGDAGRYFAPRTERLQARVQAELGPAQVSKLGHKLTVSFSGADWAGDRERFLAWLPGLVQESTGQPFYRAEDVPDSPSSVGLTLVDERIDAERLATDRVGGEPLADYAALTEAYSGEHDGAGIVVAVGPGIPAGARADQEASLLDVAPTALSLLGLPAAQDMPGVVRFGAGTLDGVPAERRWPRVPTWSALAPGRAGVAGDAEVNEEQLRALGYIE
jgi:hypothetical protein